MNIFKQLSAFKRIQKILGWRSGGIYKRIDENAELFELLKKDAPDFLKNNSWVEGWLRNNDEFLRDLAKSVPVKEAMFPERNKNSIITFPREWPSN